MYNTGNPIPSAALEDMADNAQVFDNFVNSSSTTTPNRNGASVKTRAGFEADHDSQIATHENEHDSQIATHENEHDAQIATHENEHDAQMQSFEDDFYAQILNMGFTRVGTFAAGATLTNPRQTLLWDIADDGDGQEYGWSGAFPKVVPSTSTPASTGGISVSAWISRFDPELRTQAREALRRSYAEARLNLVDGSFDAGGTLVNANDVLLHEASGKAYGWAGAYPKVVAAGSSVSGYVDKSSVKDKVFQTVNAMKSAGLQAGIICWTLGFNAEGDGGGASYIISNTSSAAANARTIIAMNNGKFATLRHDGTASTLQAGAPVGADVSIGQAVPSLLAVGVKIITCPHKRVTFSGTVDLAGATLVGTNTVWSAGNFINGNFVGIGRESAKNSFLTHKAKVQPAISKSRNKILVKCSQTPNGASSPLGELYCVISPSSYGGVAMFFIGNGTGTTDAGNLGAPFDRLRVWNTYLANDGVVMRRPGSTTGTVVESSFDYLDRKYSATISTRWSPTAGTLLNALNMSSGATATFTIPATKDKSNVSFYTSSESTADATITVNGEPVKTFSAKDGGNKVKVIEFDTPVNATQSNTVVINSGTGTLYLFGVDCYAVSNLPFNAVEATAKYNGKLVMYSYTEMTYSGTGASIDTVFVDANGTFGGSYHGGDLCYAQQCEVLVGSQRIRCSTSAYTETNTSLKLIAGEFITGQSIRLRYVGTISTTPVLDFRYSLDFGIDGGCNVTSFYSAKSGDVGFRTIFTGMHSTSRQLLNTPTRSFSSTATGSIVELDDNETPLYQYGNSNNQLFIVPSEGDESKSTILGRLWDDVNYLKYYYTPINVPSASDSVVLKAGDTYSFSCLYQYGRGIV